MKVIILAAGQGSRLRPLTDDRPKSMVALGGKPLLQYQLDVMQAAGISKDSIAIVTGYRREHQEALGYRTFTNLDYMTTNMVYSLFCASDWMAQGDDLLIAYGDIVYDKSVLDALLDTKGDIVVSADTSWQKLWSARAEDVLADAETFSISDVGNVVELGKPALSLSEIDAQYMGLIKVSAHMVPKLMAAYDAMLERGKPAETDNMFMTDFLDNLIKEGWCMKPALVDGHWVEVDTVDDLNLYQSMMDADRPSDLGPLFASILSQ